MLLLVGNSAFGGSQKYQGELSLKNAVTPEGVELGKLTLRYKFDAFMGEAVQKFVMAWEPTDEGVKLGSIKLHAQVAQSGHTLDAWIKCSPMIPQPHQGFSWDFPGSPDWDEFFFTAAGNFLPEKEAKVIFKTGFELTNLRVVDADTNVAQTKLPLDSFVGKTQIRTKNGPATDLESALQSTARENPAPTGRPPDWQHDHYARWTQGGRGTVEKWHTRIGDRSYDAVRLTMDFLPTGLPRDREPENYAEVALQIFYPFLKKKQSSAFKLKEGETWVGLWESPPSPEGWTSFTVHAQADRAMTNRALESENENETPAFDPFAEKQSEPLASGQPAETTESQPNDDPFARASADLAAKQRQTEIARGVTTRVYLVIEANRIVDAYREPLFQSGTIILSEGEFKRRSPYDDVTYRRKMARQREEEKRAAYNQKLSAEFDSESDRMFAALKSREDRFVYTDPMTLIVSERRRDPVELTQKEQQSLDQWLDSIQPELLRRIPLEGKYHRDGVELSVHLFLTRAEAEAFLHGKLTRALNRTFQF